MDLFGALFNRKVKDENLTPSFTRPSRDDGAMEVDSNGGYLPYNVGSNTTIDLDETINDDRELILSYRGLSGQLVMESAIDEIVNSSIITNDLGDVITLSLDNCDITDAVKEKITTEFKTVLKLLNFKYDGYKLFKKWYVDGRIVFHKIISTDKPKLGIQKIINIDPIDIKLIREYKKTTANGVTELYDTNDEREYYLYSQHGFFGTSEIGLKIDTDCITFVPSGLTNSTGKQVISYLNKSIRIFNNLRLLEDALVVLRVSRAPERRVFSVDTGSMQNVKAEQFLKATMNRFRNKMTYDANTGKLSNKKNIMSMSEDWWFSKSEGGTGTTVDTLRGDTTLGELRDVEYFKDKLYNSLNVPISRLRENNSGIGIGHAAEVTRDELKYSKFIGRLRQTFSAIFVDLLKTQLVLKSVLTLDEWDAIEYDIDFVYTEDNYFSELKEMNVLQDRIGLLRDIESSSIASGAISKETIRKRYLKQSDDDIKHEDALLDSEELPEPNDLSTNPDIEL